MIYLAHPYTTGVIGMSLSEILEEVAKFTFSAHVAKYPIYSPVLMGDNILRKAKKKKTRAIQAYDFWAWHDRHMISLCDELWVYCLSGWEKSEGIAEEVSYAERLEKPLSLISTGPVYLVDRAERSPDLYARKWKLTEKGGLKIERKA